MTTLQEIIDFGWVAMELLNPWWTAELASDWATGYSHMNITDSIKVISVVDANIAPMNPYQPLPFQRSAVAQW